MPSTRRKPNTVASHTTAGAMKILRAKAGSREPRAFVKSERKRAAKVRQPHRRQAAIKIGQKRAKQHRADRKQRLRRDTTARDRSAIVTFIFRHSPRPRRY
jgi:hypothetical protein